MSKWYWIHIFDELKEISHIYIYIPITVIQPKCYHMLSSQIPSTAKKCKITWHCLIISVCKFGPYICLFHLVAAKPIFKFVCSGRFCDWYHDSLRHTSLTWWSWFYYMTLSSHSHSQSRLSLSKHNVVSSVLSLCFTLSQPVASHTLS